MDYAFSIYLYDNDGDVFEKVILAHIGENIIIKFKDVEELETFANSILKSIPEIQDNINI